MAVFLVMGFCDEYSCHVQLLKLHIVFGNVTQLFSNQELATMASLEVVLMTSFLGQRYIFFCLKFYFGSISSWCPLNNKKSKVS